MNKSETKLMKALRGEPTKGVPFWEVWYGMGALSERLLGHPPADIHDQVKLAQMLGWDNVIAWIPARHPGATYESASDGSSHYVQHGRIPLEELQNRPDPDYSQIIETISENVRIASDAGLATICYLPWCFHAVNTALGLEHLSYLVYDDPEYLDQLFEWVEEGNRRAIRELIIPADIDAVLFDGDCAYKTGLMVRPETFRDLVFDRTQQTVSALKDQNIPYTFHSDGRVDDFLPVLIELGFSGFHGVEAQANDLADVKKRFGSDITLVGNMDVVFLSEATVSQVRAETEKMLTIGMQGGRYAAACNTSPLDYIPQENYLAMVDVIKNF